MPENLNRAYLEQLDQVDELASFREAFQLPGAGAYFNGNSLGPRPKSTMEAISQVMDDHWGRQGGASWSNEDWMARATRVGDKIAALIGAEKGEVIIADSTTINLVKMVGTALSLNPERTVVLTEEGNFPTDLYVLKNIVARTPGLRLKTVPKHDLMDALDEHCALLVLTHIDYKTGARHDMQALTETAHQKGALCLWDLSHSAGAVAVDLNAARVDFAVGCTYKFLNGGPGAPAYLFVARRHQHGMPVLPGWMGHEAPFDFASDFIAAEGIARHLTGTPPVLALSVLECGVDLMNKAGMAKISEKSARLGDIFIQLVQQRLAHMDITIISPHQASKRGAQICLETDKAEALVAALEKQGLITDFRPPNIIRLGLAALYVRYQDLWDVADALACEYAAIAVR